MTQQNKAILVGRHNPDLGSETENFEIVGRENVMFSLKKAEAIAQLYELQSKAVSLGAKVILFQNTPAVMTAALLQMQRDEGNQLGFQYAVIVSVPGPREADVSRQFKVWASPNEFGGGDIAAVEAAEAAVRFANGSAKLSRSVKPVDEDWILTVTVDPVTKFVFSHIEWLS